VNELYMKKYIMTTLSWPLWYFL